MTDKPTIDRELERAAAEGQIPGVVAMAGDEKGITYAGAFGRRSLAGEAPMSLDTVFWIASMTKAVTTVAAMQLVEQGALSLDAPIADVLPGLASPQVLEGFAADSTPRLRPAKRPITLRHLLTHTAGFTYHMWNADMGRFLEHTKLPGIFTCENATLTRPLVFDPGERWEYGINIDFAGKAVEKLSGKRLETYFKDHIFDPLGMKDTGFVIGPDRRQRLATIHQRQADGSLTPIELEVPQEPQFYMGGGGLYGTAPDYITFLRMLMNGGELDGARVLRPETVALMSRNQIGDLNVGLMSSAAPDVTNDAEFFPGMVKKWGLGFVINTEEAPTGRSAGSLAWAGLANTYYWLDPKKRVAGVILTQIFPFVDDKVMSLFDHFERAVYAA